MPWTKSNYPDSMKNLPANVRNKAIEIANALLEERHMDEGIAIATAISRAKDWAANRGEPAESARSGRSTDVKHHGGDRYVSPSDEGWEVKKEGSDRRETFDTKQEAVEAGRKKARQDNASLTIKKEDGRIDQRVSYNPNKKGKKQS
ncbi:MAG: DUF2188 domain-containing protein [Sphingobacteriales bacterium]